MFASSVYYVFLVPVYWKTKCTRPCYLSKHANVHIVLRMKSCPIQKISIMLQGDILVSRFSTTRNCLKQILLKYSYSSYGTNGIKWELCSLNFWVEGSGFSLTINKRAEILVLIILPIVIRMEIVMGKGWICWKLIQP